jgi:YD repeat-containing protein
MADINQEVLRRMVSTKLGTVSVSSDSSDFLITQAANILEPTNREFFVATANDLPDLYLKKIPNGTIVYVDSLGTQLVSNNEKWYGLDGRLFRDDAPSRTIWAWGCNASGQLSDNTIVAKSSPVSVVGGFTDWCQVSAGLNWSAAVRSNGTIWSWGCNTYGRLGDNTIVDKSSPVSVVGGFTDWCQVDSGRYHSIAIRTSGTLWAWGRGSVGRLGDNSTTSKSSPVSVVGGFTDWCQVSAGNQHTAAVRSNGTIWSWGYGCNGRLGDNTIVDKSSPVSVVGGFTDWCQVSAGCVHSAAVRTNGTVWAWGIGVDGRLGDNTIVAKSSPVSVVGGFTDWCQVSAGDAHTAAVRINGTIWSWGSNICSRLGDNTIVDKSSPVSVVGGFTDWCQVSVGNAHSTAVRTNGTIWSWGSGSSGKLGDNTIVDKSSPISVVGGFTDWCQVGAGVYHTAALRITNI